MFVRGIFPEIFLFVFNFLFVHCYVEDENVVYVSANYWNADRLSLRCYDCNSDFDPRCGDPFDSSTIGIVNCSELKPPEHLMNLRPHDKSENRIKPTVCRKIVQKVDNYWGLKVHKRVIRECGYIRSEYDDKKCAERSGTKDIDVTYCSCTKSLCNTGHHHYPLSSLFLVVFIVVSSVICFWSSQCIM